jgi:ribosomal protein L19E
VLPRPALKPITRDEILSLVRRGVITFPEHAMTDSVQKVKRKHRKYAHRKDTRTGSHYQKRGKPMKTVRNRTKQAPTMPQDAPEHGS